MLNGMPGLVGRDSQRRHRWGVIHIGRKVQLLACGVVVVPQKIVGLDDVDIVDLRRLQDLTGGFSAGDVGTGPNLSPFSEGAANADLGPNTDDQGHTNIKKPVTAKAETTRVKHVYLK